MRKLFFIAIAFGALTLASCSKAPKLLTPEETAARVDSIYNSQVATLGPELDQACQTTLGAMVQAKADSIVAAKTAEMSVTTGK